MKIKILLLSIILFTAGNSFSQIFGIKGGMNFTTINGSEAPPYRTPYFRFNGGMFLEFPYSKSLSIIVEANYCQKGAQLTDSIQSMIKAYYQINEKLNYINIPLIYKLIIERRPFDVFAKGGIAGNILINSNRTIYIESNGIEIFNNYYYEYKPRRITVDLIFGVGMRLGFITLELRYLMGASNLYGGTNPIIAKHQVFETNILMKLYPPKKKKYKRW